MTNICAVILAGGLGTRLRSIVYDKPKSMAMICGKPFLEYQINFLKRQGVTDIILCTGFLGEQIVNHFSDGRNWDVNIRYSKEKQPLGTGGAIKNAIHMVQNRFLLLNGDSIVIFDIKKLMHFHNINAADTTIVLSSANQSQKRYGNVVMDKYNRITRFTEKGENSSYFSAGVYLLEKNSIRWDDFQEKFSIELDLFPNLIMEKKVYGFTTNSYFIDIGIPDDYKKFETDLSTNHDKINDNL